MTIFIVRLTEREDSCGDCYHHLTKNEFFSTKED